MQGFTRVVEVTKGTGGQRDGRQGDRGTKRWETGPGTERWGTYRGTKVKRIEN